MAEIPYSKTLQDELDWKLLDQLHSAVSQISSYCFEIKKFCVTTVFVVMTLMAKLTSDKLDHSLFVAGLFIPFCFWLLDSTGYFYQVKLRGTMESIRKRLASNTNQSLLSSNGTAIIATERVNLPALKLILNSGFNHSMWLYAFLILADMAIWLLFVIEIIK